MLRRAVAEAGCRGCRAVTLRAASAPAQLRLPAASLAPICFGRGISHSRTLRIEEKPISQAEEKQVTTETAEDGSTDEVPWFLEEELPERPTSQHMQKLPTAPDDAPEMMEPMIKYIFEDMGLDDISMLDLRELDPAAALGPNLIMLFGTARSETHLHVSAGRFVRWLRKHHKISAKADGLIGPGELKTKLRRLRKKAKLMGTNTAIIPRGDNGISTGWICVNFSAIESMSDAVAMSDESGRMTGFGSDEGSVTVVVQCMTEERRNELNLESLWEGQLKKSIVQGMKYLGQDATDKAEVDRRVAEKVQLPDTGSARQWKALEQASQQQRYYSTSARRLEPAKRGKSHPKSTKQAQTKEDITLAEVEHEISVLLRNGTKLDSEVLLAMVRRIFLSSSPELDSSLKRLAIMDQVLQSGEEQDVATWEPELVVTAVESMTYSPGFDLHIERARQNIEYLISKSRLVPDAQQQLRLMQAYAYRGEWERFWNIFQISPLVQVPRTREHYELAFRIMASTRDAKLCTDALRWVYAEMLKELPDLQMTGALYLSLKACILTADPMAQQLLENPPSTEDMNIVRQRQLQRREFVRVLRDVEELHRHAIAMAARDEQHQTLDRLASDTAAV